MRLQRNNVTALLEGILSKNFVMKKLLTQAADPQVCFGKE